MTPAFEDELTKLINKHSIENDSNTPDYILAEWICEQIELFRDIMYERDKWHGNNSKPKDRN